MDQQEVEQERATTSTSRVAGGHVGWDRGEGLDEQFLASTERSGMQSASTTSSGAGGGGLGLGCGGGGASGAPCGACKFLRRKCVKGCVFAPYFGAEHGAARFEAVHKIFGASNVSKLLQQIPVQNRFDAVITISYEAQARRTNPVYGCVATIAELQQQVLSLQAELSFVQAQLANSRQALAAVSMAMQQQQHHIGLHAPPAVVLPYDQTALDLVHMQHVAPGTLSAYGRVKEETGNRLEGIPIHDISIATTPNTTLGAGHAHDHHHHHHYIEVAEKTQDVQPPTDQAQLHTLKSNYPFNYNQSA